MSGKKKLFVWDFHGVLEQGNEKAVALISNIVLEELGYSERMSIEMAIAHYGLKWYQYFELLLPNAGLEECLALQAACFDRSESRRDIIGLSITATPFATDVLTAINLAPHDQVLLSNTRQQDLIWYVQTVGLHGHFKEKYLLGVNSHQNSASKAETLQEIVSLNSYDEIIIIGDSANDIELKTVAGGTTYFYHHPYLNEKHHPLADYSIDDLRLVLQSL